MPRSRDRRGRGHGYSRDEHDYDTAEGKRALLAYNSLAQVPTLILPDGKAMTETSAITLYIDELVPQAELAPPVGDPLRRELLHRLMFIVAAIYPTFTYGDEPSKWGCGAELAPRTRIARRYGDTSRPWRSGRGFSASASRSSISTSA